MSQNPASEPDSIIRSVVEMLDGGPPVWLASGEPPLLPASVGAVVATSGSTGVPKQVVLSRAALRSAAAAAEAEVGRRLTWHLALPSHYVAGLMVVVRSVVAGRPVVVTASDLSDLLPTGQGDAISIVGTQLHRALADPAASRKLAAFDLVLVGGSRIGDELRDRALAAGIKLVQSYGMSETCGGCLWDGKPLAGMEFRLAQGEYPAGLGRVVLAGAALFDGYLGDQVATQAVLREGEFWTQDLGRIVNGRLEVLARIDDVVITGGINVDLAGVRRAVAAIDAEAAVLAVPDEQWGSRIVLFATSGELASWRDRLAEKLPRPALPRQLVIVEGLPRTAGGKPDRAALLALLARA